MLDKFKRRSYRLEYIDTGDYTPEEYESCIGELQLVNRWMGDAHSLRATLFREIEAQDLSKLFNTRCGRGFGRIVACDCGLGQTDESTHECCGA